MNMICESNASQKFSSCICLVYGTYYVKVLYRIFHQRGEIINSTCNLLKLGRSRSGGICAPPREGNHLWDCFWWFVGLHTQAKGLIKYKYYYSQSVGISPGSPPLNKSLYVRVYGPHVSNGPFMRLMHVTQGKCASDTAPYLCRLCHEDGWKTANRVDLRGTVLRLFWRTSKTASVKISV